MSLPPKVLWSEGLSLGPQQFQQQDRYHEARLQRLAFVLNPHAWGVQQLRWNADALANKLLQADSMVLVFPDGALVDAPAGDALPPVLDLAKLPLDQHVFTFHAALPALKPHGGNLAREADTGARYTERTAETADLFTEALETPVSYLHQAVQLRSHLESRNAYVHFPVVRLRRLPSGAFELDPAFMPPCVNIGAQAGLAALLAGLMSKLAVKIDALYGLHRQPSKHAFEVHSGDISSFWMLHTLNAASATLAHAQREAGQHPERLFANLLALAGALMTFSQRYSLADLPAYTHQDPGPGFQRLDTIIRELVDTVISSKYFAIALAMDEHKNTHWRATLEAARIDERTLLCLAVSADMAALELVAAVPSRFKLGAPDDVERIIVSALPGMELVHMAQVPAAVPLRPNTYYFSIDSRGALYQTMLKAQALVIYVPTGMKGLKLELLAVIE
ncbi:MAG: type VI secretion system baseplate subunit TssK [Pseudomonadota bacterium]